MENNRITVPTRNGASPGRSAHPQPTVEEIASRYSNAKRVGSGWKIPCPAHNGEDPNCYLGDGDDGGLVARCWSHGCSWHDIMQALGLPARGQGAHYLVSYKHQDGRDRHVYRRNLRGGEKKIWGKGTVAGTKILLWGNDDPSSDKLVFVEGEKSAQALMDMQLPSVTPVSWRDGAQSVKHADMSEAAERDCVLWPDDDDEGRAAMDTAAAMLFEVGATTIAIVPTDGNTKNDVADYSADEAQAILATAVEIEVKHSDAPLANNVISRNSWGFDKALEHLGMELRLNKRSDAIQWKAGENDWQDLQGRFRSYTRVRISEELRFENKDGKQYPAMFGKETFDLFIEARAVAKAVDPFEQWLNDLPAWDEQPRIATMFENILPARRPELGAWAAQALICGAIARTLQPGAEFSTFPLLIGHIGVGKSLIGKCLVPDSIYYTDSLQVSSSDKECIEQAGESALVELAELAGLTKKDAEHFKSFSTRTIDTARLAYRTDPSRLARRWICYGTSNHSSRGALLDDESGNRRVLVVVVGPENPISADKQAECGKRIVDYMKDNREQLWAEGLHLYEKTKDTRSLYAPTAHHWQLQKEDEEQATQRNDYAEELADYAEEVLFAKTENKITFEDILLAKGLVSTLPDTPSKLDTPSERWVSESVRLRSGVSSSMARRGFKKKRMMTKWGKRTAYYL